MSLGGYVFTLGAAFVTVVAMVASTFFFIRLDEPKRDKNKATDA